MDIEDYVTILQPDESMRDFLQRISSEPVRTGIPFIDNSVTLRPGNVVEFAGTEGSGKTEFLLHTAITCIVSPAYGGLGAHCIYVDVDGRLDAVRFTIALGQRLGRTEVLLGQDRELTECLRRCKICRCDSSAQYLALLKTLGPLLADCKKKGNAARMLLIDGVDAFYYCDRAHKDEPEYRAAAVGSVVTSASPMAMQKSHAAAAAAVRSLAREYRLLVLTSQTVFPIPPRRQDAARDPDEEAGPVHVGMALHGFDDVRKRMAPAWRSIVTHQLYMRLRPEEEGGANAGAGQEREETRIFAQWVKLPETVQRMGAAVELRVPLRAEDLEDVRGAPPFM